MLYEVTTTDLSKFGYRELKMAAELLTALTTTGAPPDFGGSGITVMMNMNSGNVFLTNDEYQVAMMNGDDLESFYTCSECGVEGFADEVDWNEDEGRCGACVPKDEDEDAE